MLYREALLVISTLESKKTLENQKFEVENTMEREDMSTGHRGLVSLPVHPLEKVKKRRHD